ncbi:unnamed protein product, partial [Rotaria sordida]
MGICSVSLSNDEKRQLNKQHEHVKNMYSIETTEQQRVRFEVETIMPTIHGKFRTRVYSDLVKTSVQHVVIIAIFHDDRSSSNFSPYVCIHSECVTGEIFDCLKCHYGPQLNAALDKINEVGGLLIYLRDHMKDKNGLDTVVANIALGFPADNRKYDAAAAILNDLGIVSIRLLINNSDK